MCILSGRIQISRTLAKPTRVFIWDSGNVNDRVRPLPRVCFRKSAEIQLAEVAPQYRSLTCAFATSFRVFFKCFAVLIFFFLFFFQSDIVKNALKHTPVFSRASRPIGENYKQTERSRTVLGRESGRTRRCARRPSCSTVRRLLTRSTPGVATRRAYLVDGAPLLSPMWQLTAGVLVKTCIFASRSIDASVKNAQSRPRCVLTTELTNRQTNDSRRPANHAETIAVTRRARHDRRSIVYATVSPRFCRIFVVLFRRRRRSRPTVVTMCGGISPPTRRTLSTRL